jgi:DNA recombination protein RmuC
MELIFLFIGLLTGAVAAGFIGVLVTRSKMNAQLNAVQTELGIEQEKLKSLVSANVARDTEAHRQAQDYAAKEQQQKEYIHNIEKYNAANEANLKAAQERSAKDADEILSLKEDVKAKTNEYNEANKRNADLQAKNEAWNDKMLAQKETITTLENEVAAIKNELRLKAEEYNTLNKKSADLAAKNDALNDKLAAHKEEIIELQKTAQFQFEKIANQILEEKTDKFTAANKANIEALLKPLGENIEKFKTKVEETYDKESKQRFSLEEKVKELIEQTNIVSAEANNLASALKGQSKKQGNWGEVILESILQRSGLVKDREYFVQPTIKDEEGRSLRPDVLVHLPDNRVVIIDSKVSLVGYDRFCAADTTEEQATYLAEHMKSVRGHIEDLHGKKYDNLETALDFTMMFIPIEPAYMVAIQADQELWAYAYARRILLISPTNLIACLKLIADLWKREMQSKNALEIVKRGELLYEKFVGFVDTIEDMGRHITRTQTAYNNAVSQLKTGSGNLVGQAQKLKGLGLKSNKEVSPAMQATDDEE